MKISTKGRYALRMMLDLAAHQGDGYVALKDIAQRQEISKKYLEQIVPMLGKSDILRTTRGYQGGYRLARAPKDYTVGEILRLTEGGADYLSLRKTKAEIVFSEHRGLKLPAQAVRHDADGTDYVYVLCAGVVERRGAELIYSDKDCCLADPNGSGEWMTCEEITVKGGKRESHTFPASFQARWLRVCADADVVATVDVDCNYRQPRQLDPLPDNPSLIGRGVMVVTPNNSYSNVPGARR